MADLIDLRSSPTYLTYLDASVSLATNCRLSVGTNYEMVEPVRILSAHETGHDNHEVEYSPLYGEDIIHLATRGHVDILRGLEYGRTSSSSALVSYGRHHLKVKANERDPPSLSYEPSETLDNLVPAVSELRIEHSVYSAFPENRSRQRRFLQRRIIHEIDILQRHNSALAPKTATISLALIQSMASIADVHTEWPGQLAPYRSTAQALLATLGTVASGFTGDIVAVAAWANILDAVTPGKTRTGDIYDSVRQEEVIGSVSESEESMTLFGERSPELRHNLSPGLVENSAPAEGIDRHAHCLPFSEGAAEQEPQMAKNSPTPTHFVELVDTGEMLGELCLEGLIGEERMVQVRLIPDPCFEGTVKSEVGRTYPKD